MNVSMSNKDRETGSGKGRQKAIDSLWSETDSAGNK